MADENLRLRAEVVDGFTAPLGRLRAMLRGVHEGSTVEKTKATLEGTKTAAGALGREFGNTLTPALNAAGIASLTVSGALLGLGASVRAFTGNAAGLQLLSRETNMTVNAMRVLGEVGKRFDIAPESMQQSFRTFAENTRLLKKGLGEVTTFLHSQSPAVAQWAAQFRKDLNDGLDPDLAYRRALEFMRRIKDPVERGMFAEKMFGNRQLGILGSEDIGKLIDELQKKLGELPKGAADTALQFKHAWDDLITSMIRLRDTVGVTVMPALKELTDATTKWLNDPAVREGIGKAFDDLGKTLREIDWKALGSSVASFFGVVGTAVSNTIEGLRSLVQILKALQEGRPLDALKLVDDELMSKVVPKDIVPSIRDQGKDDTGPLIERRSHLMRQIERMDEIIGRKESQPDPLGGTNSVAAEERRKRDRLIAELEALKDELQKTREERRNGGATVQQQSFDTTNEQFGGAKLQLASLGAAARAGNALGAFHLPVGRIGGGGSFGAPRVPIANVEGGGSRRSAPDASPSDGIMSMIRRLETGKTGDDQYATITNQWRGARPDVTKMTVDQVIAFQRQMRQQGVSDSAVGAYQINGITLEDFKKRMRLSGGETFDKGMQDRIAGEIFVSTGGDIRRLRGRWSALRGVTDQQIREALGGAGTGDAAGLRIKPGQAFSGGRVNMGVLDIARAIQGMGGVNRFTAFNDRFHVSRPGSLHNKGMAGDFSITDPRQSAAMAERVREHLRGAGLKDGRDFHVIDEYRNPSRGSTGGHIHYELRNRQAAAIYQQFAEEQRKAKAAAEAKGQNGTATVDKGLSTVARDYKNAQAAADDKPRGFDPNAFNRQREGIAADKPFGALLPKLDESIERTKDALNRRTSFDDASKALKERPPSQMNEAINRDRATTIDGAASIDINFKNPPAGMSTSTSTEGIFRDVKLTRGKMPSGMFDI